MTRRRRRIRGVANHERWLVSYADFITLLFAFFVVLYASAQVDQRKIGKLALAIQQAFQQLGVFPASNIGNVRLDESLSLSALPPLERQRANDTHRAASAPDIADPSSDEEANLAILEDELQEALHHEIATHAVSLHRETEGLVVSLREFGFFDSGSAELRPSALPALDRIASILAMRTCKLRIEGHTDDVPIHTTNMATNWELSTARATELVRLLILRYGFSPERLSAAGYAQYHPIASNKTPQGRAQNRRVDLVILSLHPARFAQPLSPAKPSPAIP